ncbi:MULTISPECIES: glycosyltransferase family 2 protein [unclassified Acinetobacter]|uniref:glycosyltransferase family 2 protein n=1 Tax=unclassified Acinetobacter TaxID=196816 RepID=UPI0015D29836
MSKVLSVIVPIYNVELYVEDCINSLIKQIDHRIEVILVDDGTPDQSMNIIKKQLENLPDELKNCFYFIYQENLGQSEARNNALKIATGNYISFLDSDDIVADDYISEILNAIKDYNVDIISFKSSRFCNKPTKDKIYNNSIKLTGFYELNTNLIENIFDQCSWFLCFYTYKKELFNDIFFPKGYYFEDANIIPEVFLRAKNIYFSENIIYHYRVNYSGSLLGLSNANIEKQKLSYKYILSVYKERLSVNKLYTSPYVSMYLLYILFLFKNGMYISAFIENKEFKKSKNLLTPSFIKNKANKFYFKRGLLFIFLSKTYSVLKSFYK